jgi:hypothetical protein
MSPQGRRLVARRGFLLPLLEHPTGRLLGCGRFRGRSSDLGACLGRLLPALHQQESADVAALPHPETPSL